MIGTRGTIDIYVGYEHELKQIVVMNNNSWFSYNIFNNNEWLTPEFIRLVYIIDGAKEIKGWNIKSAITDTYTDMLHLSTGCKTALNCLCYPDKIFNVMECGENALIEILRLPKAKIYFRDIVPLLLFVDVKRDFTLHLGSDTEEHYTSYNELVGRVCEWL